MDSDAVERRLAAIVSADVVGYSRLMSNDEVGTVRTLTARREEIGSISDSHGGRVVDSPGDNILMEFPSATSALGAAVEMQQRMSELNSDQPTAERMDFRMGVNVGEVIVDGARIYGDGVNIAARLEALAQPGGIWMSKTVRDQVRSKIPIEYIDEGIHTLKNIVEPVHAFSIQFDDMVSQLPSTARSQPIADSRAAWIAVLPFDNLGGDPDQDYFADGIAEDIITGLSAFRTLRVISRTSSFRYRDSSLPIPTIADELGVRFVLEGSVRKAGDRVRVTAQLIEAPDRHHVWAERYDSDLDDIFEVQDRIAESIVIAIDPAIRLSEAANVSKKRPESISAWDHVQRGLVEMSKAKSDANIEARRHFSDAIQLDPEYAGGHVGVAWTYFWDAFLQWADDPTDSLESAYRFARQAVELDPLDAWSHTALAGINLWMGRLEAASSAAERAIELNPSMAYGYVMLAASIKYAGEPGRAIGMFTRAIELSPRDPWANWFIGGRSLGHFMLGDLENAVADASSAIKARYGYLTARIILVASLDELGESNRARQELQNLLAIHPSVTRHILDQYPFSEATEVHRRRLIDGLLSSGLED